MKEFDKKGNPSRDPSSEGMKGLSKFLPMTDSNYRRRLTEYEVQVQDLQAYVRSLETETGRLRKKLEDAPKEFMILENKLREANRQLVQAFNQNEKLVNTLYEAREQITSLKEEVDKLCAPPSTYGVYLSVNEDGTVNILSQGRKVKVNLHPSIKAEDIKPGQELILNEGLNVVETAGYEIQGEVVILKEQLDAERAIVTQRADEDRVGIIADPLRQVKLKIGDHLLIDAKSGYLLEKLPKSEVEDLSLEEVPDISYDDIGGLGTQLETIKDAVELPYLYAEYYKEHHLAPPKGVLLYGPPGCGKTMIAKAVANNLAARISEKRGEKVKGFFLNIKGPELLNKYVGETERQIRLVFQRAREKSEEGVPVIVFFDEMDSLFRTRGTGISSDMESTIVPQLLAEIDGVETLKNVIVIGASNREDLIDPAILRPGRLDVKIKIERPDEGAAAQIFARYLTSDLPLDAGEVASLGGGDRDKTVQAIIERTVVEMYRADDDNRFLEVTYQNGDKEIMYFKDFASGAMIENIVRRAKKLAIKRRIADEGRGIRADDLIASIKQEYKEHEDLPNTTNPDDWAKISGKKGERIVFVRTLLAEGDESTGGRQIERVTTGQYL
jgi:proteasome-associated ATPase